MSWLPVGVWLVVRAAVLGELSPSHWQQWQPVNVAKGELRHGARQSSNQLWGHCMGFICYKQGKGEIHAVMCHAHLQKNNNKVPLWGCNTGRVCSKSGLGCSRSPCTTAWDGWRDAAPAAPCTECHVTRLQWETEMGRSHGQCCEWQLQGSSEPVLSLSPPAELPLGFAHLFLKLTLRRFMCVCSGTAAEICGAKSAGVPGGVQHKQGLGWVLLGVEEMGCCLLLLLREPLKQGQRS